MTKVAVQKEVFPLAGLLTKVNVQTLAKLSMLSLSKPEMHVRKTMSCMRDCAVRRCVQANRSAKFFADYHSAKFSAQNLTKPHFEKFTTGCLEDFSEVTTRGKLSFVTSTSPEFSDSIKKGDLIKATHVICLDGSNLSHIQPFGSMPCFKSSLRANAFSQLPRLTPSRLAASFNCWRNSGVIRIWKVGDRPSPFGVLSLLIVDMYVRNPLVWILLCPYVITSYIKIATPRTVRAAPRRLTNPLIEVTVMAGSQHTQTHPKFTWRFLALSANTRNVIHITTTTEREARDQSPDGYVMVFAGRLPAQEVSYVA